MAKAEYPKIFIIEDDQGIRETLGLFLASEGYGVELFANGKEALARLLQEPEPCLILLDLMMPIMSGAEFMEEFAKFPTTIITIPVYLFSAAASDVESRRLGCHGYIKKPVDLSVLLTIVKNSCQMIEK